MFTPVSRSAFRKCPRESVQPPVLECMLWHYAHGKPSQHIEHRGQLSIAGETEVVRRLKAARLRLAQRPLGDQ